MGMPVKSSITALIGIGMKAVLHEEGGGGTWECGIVLLSLAKKEATTIGSEFVP